MLTDRERLARRRAHPLLVELHRALTRLTSVLTVMNTGAHPDDEQSGLLATLRHRYGMRIVIACSTRGEGGQNGLGPERGEALGIVRTRELEEAARVLDADVAWLGFGPDDPVHDFGFSKNGVDTLARWDRERLLERLVRAYRRERPDIVIPTFLDVPGQHGHHRAMTEAAETAIALAADPRVFPAHAAEGLGPWRVAKYYLPAWPGGGGTYDDELPPPNATVLVDAGGRDAATGASYAEIGQWSRAYHATQGMGRWQATPQTSWALHLKSEGGPEQTVADGLPADLDGLGRRIGGAAGMALSEAQDQIVGALAAFPERASLIARLAEAAAALERAERALDAAARDAHGHRLARKRREIDAALLLAAGVTGSAWLSPATIVRGGGAQLAVHVDSDLPVELRPIAGPGLSIGPSERADGLVRYAVAAAADAALTSPFTSSFCSMGGNGVLSVEVAASIGGRKASLVIDLEEPPAIVPPQSVSIEPEAVLIPLPAAPDPIAVTVRATPPGVSATLAGAPGLEVVAAPGGAAISPSATLGEGRTRLPVEIEGAAAFRETAFAYPHIGGARSVTPAALDVLALECALPTGARIGYAGGGADRVDLWLERMGLAVDTLDAEALAGDLGRYSTIVVGIFGFGLRPDLAAAIERLHEWVGAGGHLVTLYHRPSDGWDPLHTPPARLSIGSPSLRWRVTDPGAEVTMLAPDHPLLRGPNRIGPSDWAGWDKERGLYFAAEWDAAYVPLLALSDRGEAPLNGALLSARIGRGRHTHTGLVLHHQMDKLVPGAFRLMANLMQPA